MNKKGVALSLETIIIFLIIIVVALAVLFGFFYPKFKEGSSSVGNLQKDILEGTKDFGNIGKSFLLEEKEKCQKFTNIQDCMFIEKEKTGCFWGNIQGNTGCYSCKNNKYFGEDFGKCIAYNTIFFGGDNNNNIYKIRNANLFPYLITENKKICEFNPCKFLDIDSKTSRCVFNKIEETNTINTIISCK